MEGHAVISADVLASYAADAALEVAGVHGLVGSALHRHEGVKVSREDDKVGVELHVALDWGAARARSEPRSRPTSPNASSGWPTCARTASMS